MNILHFLNKKNLKKYTFLIKKIHHLEETLYKETKPDDIAEKLFEVKENKSIKDSEKTLHAMAIARIASKHSLGMSYYDVQLMGALSLVDGCISEMKTGEGKTLTCSAAVAANYVLGFKTHVATANEYLAQRDQQTLAPLYNLLGISSAFTIPRMEKHQKKQAYQSDVLYSTAQELGFDFLKDNLLYSMDEKVQPLSFNNIKAIIDEADFILIDEARTPLIISGESPVKDAETYQTIKQISQNFKKMSKAPSDSFLDNVLNGDQTPDGDFWIDEKNKTVYLSEIGYKKLEKLAFESSLIKNDSDNNTSQQYLNSIYQSHNSWILHEVLNALKAEHCYKIDKDYIVHDGEIIIVDQNTGRLSEGRTWSYGLHQAIEAKENVNINPETMTLGSISIQNYFRNYLKISGMSGTVMNSSEEFQDIYQTNTIQIPTNKKMVRIDHQDKIYLSMNAKYNGIIQDVCERHAKGQPILIGTTSVQESEIISDLLSKKKIPHHVLNAKNHFKEAQIIAQAGQPFAVTVSTSMAGRGTDIILGGNKEALLSILNGQLEAIIEREAFFIDLAQQLNLPNGEQNNQGVENSNNIGDENQAYIDHNDIQEQIGYLYSPQHMNGILNQGLSFIKRHLAILERTVKRQIEIVETSSEKWREHVLSVGGLYVLGSSRNESRRIDDQLRGRSGRQGDPGESTFYLSIEDPWVNIFGKSTTFAHLAKSFPSNEAISSPILTRSFARAQASIESHHFNARKDTFQYDSIADEGRRQFLKLRDSLLINADTIKSVLKGSLLDIMIPMAHPEFLDFMEEKLKIDLDDHKELLKMMLGLPINEIRQHTNNFLEENIHINLKDIKEVYLQIIESYIDSMLTSTNEEAFQVLNSISLKNIDKKWTERLIFIEDARQSVTFSALAQKNPLYEFKKLCFDSFASMIDEFKVDLIDNFVSVMNAIKEQEKVLADESTQIIRESSYVD